MNDDEPQEDRPKSAEERYREIGKVRIQEIREQLKDQG